SSSSQVESPPGEVVLPTDTITAKAPPPPAPTGYARLDRATFNRIATRLNLPVYWAADANKNGIVDPDEVKPLLFFPTAGKWVDGGAFTADFAATYEKMVAAAAAAPPSDAREAVVQKELDDAASVLVLTDMKKLSEEDRAIVDSVLVVANLVDELYAKQIGASAIASKVAPDAASQSLFRRSWGPGCKTPRFEKDPSCSAIVGGGEELVDVYPESVQKKPDFCKALEKEKDAKKLLDPFTVVREDKGKLVSVPYATAYATEMGKISAQLEKTAALVKDPAEAAFKKYLLAAAASFKSGDWKPADEAWAKMNSKNSKFYLRIAPDETYWEPCSQKAGFHATFALIDRASLELQDKLTPLQQQMEDDLGKLIGAPYKARKVTFHLPDFIHIVINAGDDRDAVGATIGQSLPNWGPVANEGRGRTVAMTNLYMDPDSQGVRRQKAASLLAPDTMAKYVDEPGAGLLSTVLHEATHNLGPAHEYKYKNQKDDEAFGGDLASMLEELKAQSGAYFYLLLLKDKGVIDQAMVDKTIVDSLVWSLNHISRGMYAANGQRKAYSQLAAIQVGYLMDQGAITWDEKATAANGKDQGAFKIDFAKMSAASIAMMKTVATIKATNDKAAALDLANKYVEKGSRVPQAVITERMLRFPQPNFVYGLDR
ncbi:MAG TPA: hypothetical protein VL400_07555, partial [Polyangiaceae bacterium]|nr:hypothetical protein [Polyangiaceae bacterium]